MMRRFALLLIFTVVTFMAQEAMASNLHAVTPPKPPTIMLAAAEIGQQIQTLVTGDPNAEVELEQTFGTRALGIVLGTAKLVASEASRFAGDFAAIPDFGNWLDQQISTPYLLERWTKIGLAGSLSIGMGIAVFWLLSLAFLPLRVRIYKKTFVSGWSRAGGTLWWLVLLLIPVVAFLGTTLYLLDIQDPQKLTRFVVLTVINAFSVFLLARALLKFFLAANHDSIRFLPITNDSACFFQRWLTWLGGIFVFSFFLLDVAKAVKVPDAVVSGFSSLIALVATIMAIRIVTLQRSHLAGLIRGNLSAARKPKSFKDSLRLWAARTWHAWAIAYLLIGYFVTMLGVKDGFILMLKGTAGTLVAILGMSVAFYYNEKLTGPKNEGGGVYRIVFKYIFTLLIWGSGLLAIGGSWGMDVSGLLTSPIGQRFLGSAFSIVMTVLGVLALYEFISRAIEKHLNKTDEDGNIIEANSRARTLLPMLRKAILIILGVIVFLVVLSELGVDITPILAGAGVLGVAVGFGSQTLIKDFLTGLFIILEDSIAVGEIVTIGSQAGVVEDMSLRTVRLRDVHGSVHIIPFSEITSITNNSKGFSFAVVDAGVAYDSDIPKVMEIMKSVCSDMRKDPQFNADILDDFEVMGLEMLGDFAVTVRGRFKTRAGKHFGLRRHYYLRMKQAFDENGIEIPFPVVTHLTKPAN